MRIRHRLLLGFMAVVAVFILFGGYVYSVWQSMNSDMHRLDELFEVTSERNLHELDMTLHLGRALETARQSAYAYLLGDAAALTELEESNAAFDAYYTDLTAMIAAVDSNGTSQDVLDALAAIEAEHEHFEEHIDEVVALIDNGDRGTAVDLWTDTVAEEAGAISAALEVIEGEIELRAEAASSAFDDVIHGVEGRIRSMQNVMIAVLGAGILLAFGIGIWTARSISEPIEALSAAALAVEAGDFDPASLDGVGARPDEIGNFARIFQHMAAEVHRREQQLRARIGAMRIEIDRQKSNEQVAEITETDFFKDLQTKARAMRGE